MSGTLYGVGVGPGDPELLTLRAHRLISSASVIAYPAPDNAPSFSRQIVADFIPENCIEIPVIIPMRSLRFPAQEIYDQAASQIQTHLDLGKDVITLCEGDPFFYGSFMYLFARLSKTASVQIVPGVSALGAISAAAKTPLCARNSCLSVIPATLPKNELYARLKAADAAAFIKVGQHLEKLREIIEDLCLGKRAIFIAHASLPNQTVCPLRDAPQSAPYFSMVLIAGKDPYV